MGSPQAGEGPLASRVEALLEARFGHPVLLVSSATHALEMMAMLFELEPGDEILLPSFTFVSSANAFVIRGIRVGFVDCDANGLIDLEHAESLIGPNTKAMGIVHYAGYSCDIAEARRICDKYSLFLFEDAAQAIGADFKGRPLGSFGDLSCLSFHQTKNISCGEGGALIINRRNFYDRARIIRQKGTNRHLYLSRQVSRYSWVDIGSSYLLSEFSAAVLLAQLEHFDDIQRHRELLWKLYAKQVKSILPASWEILQGPEGQAGNAHLFALLAPNRSNRDELIRFLNENGVEATSHFVPLHQTPFVLSHPELFRLKGDYECTVGMSERILRLPLYFALTELQVLAICRCIHEFFAAIGQDSFTMSDAEGSRIQITSV